MKFSTDSDEEEYESPKGKILTSESHPLRVDFVKNKEFPILQRLGMTFAPGKKQFGAISGNWNRDLGADLRRLRNVYLADTLVSLIEDEEIIALGIADLEAECRRAGIELTRFPVRDVSVPPSPESFTRLIDRLVERLERQKTVVLHCKGGLGRAGLAAACTAMAAVAGALGAAEAIKIIRTARPGTIETREQERFVSFFREYWKSNRSPRG